MSLRDLVGMAINPAAPGALPEELEIKLRSQQVSVWCWAACIEMVLQARGVLLRQCQVVTQQLGQTCCPGSAPPPACQQPLAPALVEVVWQRYLGHPVIPHSGALPQGQLIQAIDPAHKRPVQVWLGEKDDNSFAGSGHVLLVVDHFQDEQGQAWFVLRDPNPNSEQAHVSYDGLVSGMSYGDWVGSWTNI